MERITSIIGAGAVLDFDFQQDEIKPTTENITQEMCKIEVPGVDGAMKKLVKNVYVRLKEAHYETPNPKICPEAVRIINPINFETLFHVVENMMSYSSIWKDEWISPFIFPPVAAFVECKEQFAKYETEEYHRALVRMENRICEIVGTYDTKFADEGYAVWYKNFWNRFKDELDVFTLNYDTTIEQSLGEYEDGFEEWKFSAQRFDPGKLLNNKERTTVNHLHGCIAYLNQWHDAEKSGYSFYDMFKFATYKQRSEKNAGYSGLDYNQAHEAYIQRSILVGMRKPDKIVMNPMNFYHANLVNKICENRALLIAGYSFGDTYVNEYLYKMQLIHGDKRRIVLIDKWMISRQCRSAMRNYINAETGNDKEYWNELNSGDYYAPHVSMKGTLMVFICGFKSAVEHHEDKIREFLMS